MSDEPVGRQPQSVLVTLVGDSRDTVRYLARLRHAAESHGDNTQQVSDVSFRIYSQAVND